jgi:DNA ligase-1
MFANPHKCLTQSYLYVKLKLKEVKKLIQKWSVQLAHKFETKRLKNGEWFSLSEKLNGVRGTFYKGKIYSRQGKEIRGLDHILKAVKAANLENFVLDGELIRDNSENLPDNENFRIGVGIIGSNASKKPNINFVIFDLLATEEFESGESTATYRQRMAKLLSLDLEVPLKIVPILYEGTDQTRISELLETVTESGKEGLILNRDTAYQARRNFGVLKIKKFQTVDLKIKSIEEGEGKCAGKAGAITVDYKGNELRVGTGFTDEQREMFWFEKPIGRVIEVSYFAESKNKKDGKLSLQFPAFVRLREFGKEVSYA